LNKFYPIIAGIIIVIIASSLAFYSQQDASEMSVDTSPNAITIGALLPATGDLASHGSDSNLAVQLAVEDFNKHLIALDSDYSMELIVEDTQTDPVVALEKIQSLNSKGISLIVGTQTSAELNNIKSYADSNGMLLISPSSTSPKLAIDDNIYRLIPDDTKQGKVLAELFVYDGIKVIVPIYRGDVWGDGLYESTLDSFVSLGGTVDPGIRYSPEVTVFSSEASLLDGIVSNYVQDGYTNDEIAVLVIGFSEVVHLFNFVGSYDNLRNVSWYGSDGSSNDDAITSDKIATAFATDVGLVTTQFSAPDSPTVQHINQALIEQTGSIPNAYAYSAYDAVWLIGNAVLETGSTDSAVIISALPDVAATYDDGAIGKITFNDAGDLAISNYALWSIGEDGWYLHGYYHVSENAFDFYDE